MALKNQNTRFILSLSLPISQPAFASSQAGVTGNQATIDFSTSVTFNADIEADANITSVVLEYGTEQLTCGEVIAKAFPQFTPDKSVKVEWTWDMRQSGSLPPGATIWWRRRYTDETGRETLSEQLTTTWLDSDHQWKTIWLIKNQVNGGDFHRYCTKTEQETVLLRHTIEAPGVVYGGAVEIADFLHPLAAPGAGVKKRRYTERLLDRLSQGCPQGFGGTRRKRFRSQADFILYTIEFALGPAPLPERPAVVFPRRNRHNDYHKPEQCVGRCCDDAFGPFHY